MKLAVFTSQYPGRTTTFFERDMRGLLEAGIEVDVFAVSPLDASMWQYALATSGLDGLKERVHHLGFARACMGARPVLSHAGGWLKDAALALGASARYGAVTLAKTAYVLPKAWAWAGERAYRYDHVLGYWGNYAGTCAWLFHRLQGRPIPFSLWLHAGADLYRTPALMATKIAHADNVFTCCEFNRDYILRRYGAADRTLEHRLHVFHHGLDLAEFPFRPEGRPAHRVMAVGRLATHKGYDYLLWAAHILMTRGVPFEVQLVGDGPQADALRTLAGELGISHLVSFTGWVPFTEARAAMSRATVLVHPSDGLGDGLPNVVREAMAVGTPVIASDVAGIPDALAGGCGVLVPPRDARALADAIEALLDDPDRRMRMTSLARRRVEERYDLMTNGLKLAARIIAARRREDAPDLARAVERRRRPRPASLETAYEQEVAL